jgi:hypothetical protein
MTYLGSSIVLVNPVPAAGQYLAHTRKNRLERAFLAADLHTSTKVPVKRTIVQCASLASVNRAYHQARNRTCGD